MAVLRNGEIRVLAFITLQPVTVQNQVRFWNSKEGAKGKLWQAISIHLPYTSIVVDQQLHAYYTPY
jgi:hypothetical protein